MGHVGVLVFWRQQNGSIMEVLGFKHNCYQLIQDSSTPTQQFKMGISINAQIGTDPYATDTALAVDVKITVCACCPLPSA